MKQYILLGLVLLGGLLARAQSIQVRDINTLSPIPHSIVTVNSNPNSSMVADDKGMIVNRLLTDLDSIKIEAIGYEEYHTTVRDIKAANGVVYLSEKSYSLEDIVLCASKFQERREDVAQPVEVIRSKELAFWNQSTTADVMQSTGNVLVQKSQLGGGSPVIRGFEANKVLMVVDGVRMNNAIYRGGHLQNIITMDNASMDRMEILFGPGSTVYGSDALGGVMHFYTKNPVLSTSDKLLVKGTAFARYGTAASEMTGHADVSLGTSKFGSLTSLTFSKFGDLRQGNNRNRFYGDWGKRTWYQTQINGQDTALVNDDVNLQVGSGYSQYDVLQKFIYRQSQSVSHTLNLQFSNSTDVPRYDRLIQEGTNGQPRYAEWYYGPQRRLFAAYTLGLNANKGIYDSGKLILAYQNIEESRHDRRFGSDNLNHRIEKLNILSLNVDFAKQLGKQELRYGLEGTYNMVNSTAFREHPSTGDTEPLDTRYPNGGSTMNSAALYATHSWEIVRGKLILNDGLRLSQVGLHSEWTDTTFFPFPFVEVTQSHLSLNGNLGLIFMPGREWRFSLLGSTGFRAPNVDDMSKVFESFPGRLIVPNPDLNPERTYNIDLGMSKTFLDAITIGGNAFYTLYHNAITTGITTFNGQDSIQYNGQLSQVITSINATQAYIYGVSGNVTIEMGPHFRMVNTLNYTYGRIETDSTPYPLDHIAPMFGRTSLQGSWKRVRAEAFVLWSGWKRLKDYNLVGEDNIAYATAYGMPAWFTLNLRASYQVHPNIQFQAALENILDQNYRVFASNIGAPGRNLSLTVRAMF